MVRTVRMTLSMITCWKIIKKHVSRLFSVTFVECLRHVVDVDHFFKAMFYIGSNCMDWPDQCRRGVTDGHHISVRMLSPPIIRRLVCVTHPMFVLIDTWSHRYMTALPNENAFAELWYAVSNGYPSQCRFIIFNGPIIRGR